MNKKHSKRDDCRLCHSKAVKEVLRMPKSPPTEKFRLPSEKPYEKFPMDLYQCLNCGHIQLLDVVDPDLLFGGYIYESSISPDLDNHFSEYVAEVLEYLNSYNLVTNSILDIGSNDGLLLDKFRRFGITSYGIDPAKEVNEKSRNKGHIVLDGYLSEVYVDFVKKYGQVNLITANNVFSHMDNMRETFECIPKMLTDNGLLVFEVSYVLDTIKNKVIDYIYHEHLAYHGVKPLKNFLSSIGLKMLRVENIDTKGGSIRVYASKENAAFEIETENIETFLSREKSLYQDVGSEISFAANYFKKELSKAKRVLRQKNTDKEKTAIFGACATVNVMIEMGELAEDIDFIIDNSPTRIGRLHPSYDIPIISVEEAESKNIKNCLIGAWRHRKIIEKNNYLFFRNVKIVSAFEENWA
jgi:SAM-dependent methyltransferase